MVELHPYIHVLNSFTIRDKEADEKEFKRFHVIELFDTNESNYFVYFDHSFVLIILSPLHQLLVYFNLVLI